MKEVRRTKLDKVKWRAIAKFVHENLANGPSDHRIGLAIVGAFSKGYDLGMRRGKRAKSMKEGPHT